MSNTESQSDQAGPSKLNAGRFVIGIGIVLALAVVIASSISIWILREEVEEHWRDQLNNLSLILAEKTSEEIASVYAALGGVVDEVKRTGAQNPAQLHEKMSNQAISAMVADRINAMPQIALAAIVTASGEVINFTQALPASTIKLTTQEFFKKHVNDPDLAVHVSNPVFDSAGKNWLFFLSRRINGQNGEFIGVVTMAIPATFFSQFFEKIHLGKGANISLYRRDFTLLARWPNIDNMMGAINLGGTSFQVIEKMKKTSAVIMTESSRLSSGGRVERRMGAPRLLEKFPFIINITITEDLFMAEWNRVATILAIFTIVSVMVLAVVFSYLVKLLNRRDEDMTATRLLQQQAEAASRAKSEFLTMMSHEIRTPLTSIIGFAELMCDAPDGMSADEAGQAILRNGQHLLRIINDILDLSKIEAGRLQLEKIGFSPLEVAWNLDSMIGAQAHGKGIEFNTEIKYPMPSKIVGDPTRWKQILLNLYGNAVKFTELGAVKTTLAYHPERSVMSCTVTDTGIGMSEEQLKGLFKPFSQADNTITRKYGGTGLGLNLVRQLVERMHGKVSVASKKGEGSAFTIEILAPLEEGAEWVTEANTVTIESVQQASKLPQNLHGRVLLAEDSPDNRRLVGTCLRRLGLDFAFAENGEEAVERAMTEEFDVILMDMQMPVMDGLTATGILRDTGYGGPIVAFTANVMTEDIERYLKNGCTHCLGKPINFVEFTKLLAELLGQGASPTSGPSAALSAFDLPEFKLLKTAYEKSFNTRLMALNTSVTQANWEEAERLAHTLKGSGGTYGYPEVSQIAGNLEHHIKHGEFAEAANAMEALLKLKVLQEFLTVGVS